MTMFSGHGAIGWFFPKNKSDVTCDKFHFQRINYIREKKQMISINLVSLFIVENEDILILDSDWSTFSTGRSAARSEETM